MKTFVGKNLKQVYSLSLVLPPAVKKVVYTVIVMLAMMALVVLDNMNTAGKVKCSVRRVGSVLHWTIVMLIPAVQTFLPHTRAQAVDCQ